MPDSFTLIENTQRDVSNFLFSLITHIKKKRKKKKAVFRIWYRLKIFKCQTSWRDKKNNLCPSALPQWWWGRWWRGVLEAAVQEKGAVPEREERRKQHLWKHLRAIKKWAETLKDWARGVKVSDDEVNVAPAITARCCALRALSAGSRDGRGWVEGAAGAGTAEAGGALPAGGVEHQEWGAGAASPARREHTALHRLRPWAA